MVLPFRNNPIHAGPFMFTPSGKIQFHTLSGRRPNPVKLDYLKEYGPSTAARFFVGLSNREGERYSIAHLVSLVRSFLKERKAPEDSSFISQTGVYTHRKKSLGVIQEQSAQVVIINTSGLTLKDFKALTIALGEHICRRMKQESVIVDFQRNGISKHIWEIIE